MLNKVPNYMFWKYHIINKYDNKNIYFNSKIIHQIMIFLLKKDLYILYFIYFKKKYNLENIINNFKEFSIYAKKNVRNFMRKSHYTQLKIIRYNDWFVLHILLYSTDYKGGEFERKSNESFFRYRHLYYYLLLPQDKF